VRRLWKPRRLGQADSAFGSYDLTASIGPITDSSRLDSQASFDTSDGGLLINSAGGATFTATVSSPEPSTMLLCGFGLATVATLKRRVSVLSSGARAASAPHPLPSPLWEPWAPFETPGRAVPSGYSLAAQESEVLSSSGHTIPLSNGNSGMRFRWPILFTWPRIWRNPAVRTADALKDHSRRRSRKPGRANPTVARFTSSGHNHVAQRALFALAVAYNTSGG